MNVRGDFLKSPHSTNTTALICKSRKFNMFYKRVILWKQGLYQSTENCRVSGPDLLVKAN